MATAKGILTAAEITARIERLEGFGRDFVGAAIVARAWTDADYRARLLDDGITAAAELGAHTGGFPARGGVTGALSPTSYRGVQGSQDRAVRC